MKPLLLLLSWLLSQQLTSAQGVGIGTSTPAASAALEINSATGAVLVPRLTIAQRDVLTPIEGMIIYNKDLSKFQGYGLKSEQAYVSSLSANSACNTAGCGPKWQTFTQPITGILTSVKLQVTVYAGAGCIPANLVMKIYSGAGTGGTLLQTTNFVAASAGVSVLTVPFHTALTAGATYTIELVSPATGCNPGGADNVTWAMNTANPYAGGYAYCCSALPTQDYAFETYVGTFDWVNF